MPRSQGIRPRVCVYCGSLRSLQKTIRNLRSWMHSMHNIKRITDSKTRGDGYEVRFSERGARATKYFSDKKHGGPEKALEMALDCRNRMQAEITKNKPQRNMTRPTARNTSGICGVRLRTTVVKKGDLEYHYEHVEASWSPEPSRVIKKNFSVAQLGPEKAWSEAVKCRNKALKDIH